jgi:hypothetical protein
MPARRRSPAAIDCWIGAEPSDMGAILEPLRDAGLEVEPIDGGIRVTANREVCAR